MLDLRAFRRACRLAALATGGQVTEFRYAECVTPSFHQGVIAYPDRTVAVVRLRDEPIPAIAEAGDSAPLRYRDMPARARPRVLRSGVAYWKPASLGEALSNYYDRPMSDPGLFAQLKYLPRLAWLCNALSRRRFRRRTASRTGSAHARSHTYPHRPHRRPAPAGRAGVRRGHRRSVHRRGQ
ncbi:hypothetical protein Afil01_11690 [Actinorhabdospora filicis]|uniref:Uncharacterized protein n=1 Tax=Actinorhabdospora filicis TaxID=1785913 RepID=A0A9W6SI35_9ACTN|nr:hypothetical protein [Actinorhabdospora filicis]GLZ76362.1 hypothetical protein Afil01_11690 [Actinorhabdospora filicis]